MKETSRVNPLMNGDYFGSKKRHFISNRKSYFNTRVCKPFFVF